MIGYLDMHKLPAFARRNVLSRHNTNRPHSLGGSVLKVFSSEPKPREQDATNLACKGAFAMWCLRGPDDVRIIHKAWQHGQEAVRWIRMLARLLWEDDLHRPLAVLRREQIWQLAAVEQQLPCISLVLLPWTCRR